MSAWIIWVASGAALAGAELASNQRKAVQA